MYSKQEKALIFLSTLDIPHGKIAKICESVSFLEDVLFNLEGVSVQLKKILDPAQLEKIQGFSIEKFERTLEKHKEDGIVCVTRLSEGYPEKLLNITNPPFVLYLKGDISLLKAPSIAVVGTRKVSAYGRQVCEMFTKGLVANGFCITSGLAYGIDGVAHKTALAEGGKTIAVLGGGFNKIYPSAHNNLASEIVEKGLLLTEYPPHVEPTAFTFPLRNRIIAGLSLGVLIPEAGEKSGSLHTKEYALDAGLMVFAIPGNITSETSCATNRMICMGSAQGVTSFEEIVSCFQSEVKKLPAKTIQLSIEEEIIVNLLKEGEQDYDALQIKSGFDAKRLTTCLTTMQIRGILDKLAGNTYILK